MNNRQRIVARCAIGGGEVAFTSRIGGVSGGVFESLNLGDHVGDELADVGANRSVICGSLGLSGLVGMTQVHGAEVVRVGGTDLARYADPLVSVGECDGIVTTEHGVGLLAMGADCLTVGLGCDDAVAAVHAGWRGLSSGVIERAVRELSESGTGQIHAAIGPAAGPCCYEVSEAVIEAFRGEAVHFDRLLDLPGTAESLLRAAGVSSVAVIRSCTICDSEGQFFSHRREGTPTGRQGAVAWLNN